MEIDTTEGARGVPETSRRLRYEVASGRTVQIEAPWGCSEEVKVERGAARGAPGGRDDAKTGVDVIYRIREQGGEGYVT